MPRVLTRRLALALVALGLTASACIVEPRHWVEDTEQFEIALDGARRVRCKVHNGTIAISGASRPTDRVHVHVTKRGGGRTPEDAAQALRNIELVREVRSGTLELGWRWKESPPGRWQGRVSFRISQPAALPVDAETHNGAIDVTSVEAACITRSHNGEIRISGCRSSLTARSHDGSIAASGEVAEVSVTSHNGDIRLKLGGSQGIRGAIESHNGNVTLDLSEENPAKVACSTHWGRIRAQRPFDEQTSGRNFLVGADKNATGELRIRTHNGDVTLRRGAAR